ncbi:MAG: hybrid sensor histidine kinase/response regulator, partial [Deltaproteobacteria bacterium]|nr:hybrid sensor histidine kinase/response regulator [Deltaproteobacteria bacterium]
WCGFLQGKRPNERELQYLLQLASQRGEQQLAERVRAAESGERERVDFLAHISHDMRSPLYNVKSIVNILRLENPAPETVELLEVARANCESLEEIIGDVLDLTRHGVGKLRASPEIFDLGACVEQVVEAFAVSARAKGLRLQCRLHEDRLAVCGDRRHLRRAISNILSNAIKYTPVGVVLVELQRDADGSSVLTIRDSGRGMSKVELAQLFKPFTRFQSEGIEGVGLGLAITKILVELSGGHIEVRSQEGKGSEFLLRFGRVLMQPEAPELANISLPDRGRVNLEGMSVLLVDDDAGCVESLARLLGRSGCRLRKCYSVGEAINLLSLDAPDCIISDGQMPGGGVELLLKAIRERRLECSLLVLSGNDDSERVESWLARGADRVLVKPATVSDIESWLYEVRRSQNETFSSQEVPLQQARG